MTVLLEMTDRDRQIWLPLTDHKGIRSTGEVLYSPEGFYRPMGVSPPFQHFGHGKRFLWDRRPFRIPRSSHLCRKERRDKDRENNKIRRGRMIDTVLPLCLNRLQRNGNAGDKAKPRIMGERRYRTLTVWVDPQRGQFP